MDEITLTKIISEQVIAGVQFTVALIGIVGVIVGAVLSLIGNVVFHWFKEKPQRDLDNRRIKILTEMLGDNRFPEKWRNLSTLSAVIGETREESKRLLIKAKARGSEKVDDKWGLIKNHPFPSAE